LPASANPRCEDEYKKYDDTVAVSIAIVEHLRNSGVVKLYGVSRDIATIPEGKITPDVSFQTAQSAALFFELKWSLTASSVTGELGSIKRYRTSKCRWDNNTEASYNDVILVVHSELAPLVKRALDDMITSGDKSLETGFAIWTWSYTVPRVGGEEPVLTIQEYFGSLQGGTIQQMFAAGYTVPKEVMQHLRFNYLFVPEKPPMCYLIVLLYLHFFSAFQSPKEKHTAIQLNTQILDQAYERMKKFYLGWSPNLQNSSQIPRYWLKEAFAAMNRIGMNPVVIPFPRTKTPLEFVCAKIGSPRKGGKGKPKAKKEQAGTTLENWLG
jgi:hypothetical protein